MAHQLQFPKLKLTRYETYQAILTGKQITHEDIYGETIDRLSPLGHKKKIVLTEDIRKRYCLRRSDRNQKKEAAVEYFNEAVASKEASASTSPDHSPTAPATGESTAECKKED